MLLFLMLLPFSLLYCLVSLLIQYTTALKQGIGSGYRSPVPVIVVGNFTVGGTGKTPLVAYLCDQLRQQGFQPGIISRGYGRKNTGILVVTENLSPQAVGDEALLLFQLTKGPMVIGSNRNQAIKNLLSIFPTVNVIISDDGLQHAGLQADIRILVVDAIRRFGNGWCLPAGPLRAPRGLGRFNQVDIVVINETAIQAQNKNDNSDLDTVSVLQYPMRFEAVGFTKITAKIPYHGDLPIVSVSDFIKAYGNKHIHAVAGIGNPRSFFQSLENLQLSITRHVYPDHHDFQPEDLTFKTPDPIIMTEKDAVKCAPWLSHKDCWTLKIRVTIEERFSGMVGQLLQGVGPRSGSSYD
jgi:tetraacyldisaccharide 4'-kinase